MPTLAHDLLRVLIERGHLHHVVTQNIDSLHLRSGVPLEKQSELHGNYSLETCPLCETRYFRSHAVWKGLTTPPANPATARRDLSHVSTEGDAKSQRSGRRQVRKDHRTGRLCVADGCSGELENSVVLFGESLPAKVHFGLYLWKAVLRGHILQVYVESNCCLLVLLFSNRNCHLRCRKWTQLGNIQTRQILPLCWGLV
jgi:NAD-dependent SIR2 family protein deacetylase